MKNVLLLGAGMVSDPLVHYFSHLQEGFKVTVATRSVENGSRLSAIGPNVELVVADVQSEPETILKLIGQSDLCVSLLPYVFHAQIARMCIQKGTNMLTSSYISPELQALDQEAKLAGVTIMNEAGLDPGIDHILAMECIDSIHENNGKVKSFVSFCGGLPAPEASDNALRYKFSWSPKGMLLALLNPAKYLENGQVVEVEGNGGVLDKLYPISFMPGFNLVGYPNRDSTKYAEIYGIDGECETLLRGTLRFKGFVEAVKALKQIGYLSTESKPFLSSAPHYCLSWMELTALLLNSDDTIPRESLKSYSSLKHHLTTRLTFEGKEQGIEAIEQLGLLSDTKVQAFDTPLDTLAPYLANTLAYDQGERDLVVLNHDIDALLGDGTIERHRISLTAYGDTDGYSAMARTVGYTAAIVGHMILNGEIMEKGMLRPISKKVYKPVLKRLEKLGIKATTKICFLSKL